jgi:hypothetical protein
MFTSVDKALAAGLMAIIYFAAKYWPPLESIVTPEIVNVIVAMIAPIVWAAPNKPKA